MCVFLSKTESNQSNNKVNLLNSFFQLPLELTFPFQRCTQVEQNPQENKAKQTRQGLQKSTPSSSKQLSVTLMNTDANDI